MKIRGITYLILLAVAIIAKFYLVLHHPSGAYLDWLAYSGLLFDSIFFGILAGLLGLLQERRWLTGLAWITLIACIIRDPLGNISDEFLFLSPAQFNLYTKMLTVPTMALTLGLFFARRGPAQYCFRWLAVVILATYLVFLVLPSVSMRTYIHQRTQMIAGLFTFSLQLTILMNIVFKTPALVSAYDIEFP